MAKGWLSRPSLWVAASVVVAALLFAALSMRGPRVRTFLSAKKDLEQHVVASGRVWVPTRTQVATQVSGLVVAVGVVEGQHVKAGDLLVQMDDAEARATVAQVKATVGQASARVEQLRRVGAIVANEGLRQAEINVTRAEAELVRSKNLAATGAIAASDLESAQRTVDLARAQKTAAEAQQISSAPLGADSRVAWSTLLQAEAQLAGVQLRLAQTRISARDDGVVLTRSVEPGEVVQPARTLLVMAVDSDVQVVFQPDERNLSSMKLGQKARVSADAFPQDIFPAEVSYIAPAVDPQRGSIEVRMRVPNAPKTWKPDMTVSVDLTVAQKSAVVTIPSAAVRGASSDKPYVFVVRDGIIEKKSIHLGIRGEGSTEITDGLSAGAEVVSVDGVPLTEGQRVRAVREEP